MSESVRVEPARPEDLSAMADLLSELFTLESDFVPDRDRQLAGLALILDTPALGQLFVLREGQGILGMANALITVSTARGGRVLLLEDVIVSGTARGRGLGRLLVEEVLAWAAQQGFSRVTLLADKDNRPALDFYRHLGFQSSAMVVLRKTLEEPGSLSLL
ncbi:MAG: GNAT family N-acetyltransferase [Pseudomonadota bacterium]